ncbi:hypothetical protein GE21DRAFT_1733 [Neurospora crassa]|uniref:Protein phosphatase n=2 Tax=Neurospora crassa TaxID=5141 RepID=Q7SGG4_NEUCR|nr:5-azacytidine resistance protein azr1 [Neurospora crassa OR74A]EAA35915.1 5-azacytidine resistance protein azr1 [Neurospora crassa OR74A]KHE81130.1 hypothetical protein GE21DRAFT_1733 [Neurospora crassa]CAE76328.1 conserved hypothetical protein [Neurospora crassa]|eukprot:XP_965151.1 5-azacytidine resistance protein azr1 [Neurospora crassa OR74A]
MASLSALRMLSAPCHTARLRPARSSTLIISPTSSSASYRFSHISNYNRPAVDGMRYLSTLPPRVGRRIVHQLMTQAPYSTAAEQPASGSGTKFVYNIAASYVGKGLPFNPSTHVFHFNPYHRVSKPGKKAKSARPESGQDAFFVSRVGNRPGEVALGVADGVGGWMDSGVDPADFSHAFCDYMAAAAYENDRQPTKIASAAANGPAAPAGGEGNTSDNAPLTARSLMQKGYEAVCHDPTIKAGGSTAVVGMLDESGTMEVANLGDSGFVILRLNGVHTASEPQTHAFNTPFQLSVVPPSMLLRAATFGGGLLIDQPRDADVTRHKLKHGDVVVFGSDGLWDNLFNQDILRLVSSTMQKLGAWKGTDAGVQVAEDLTPFTKLDSDDKPIFTLQSFIATHIVSAAKSASMNAKLDGPFAKEVKKYYPQDAWHGGKEDDICVVVVLVSEEPADMATPKPRL